MKTKKTLYTSEKLFNVIVDILKVKKLEIMDGTPQGLLISVEVKGFTWMYTHREKLEMMKEKSGWEHLKH